MLLPVFYRGNMVYLAPELASYDPRFRSKREIRDNFGADGTNTSISWARRDASDAWVPTTVKNPSAVAMVNADWVRSNLADVVPAYEFRSLGERIMDLVTGSKESAVVRYLREHHGFVPSCF